MGPPPPADDPHDLAPAPPEAPPSQPVEGGDAEDPPASKPAIERFAWLPYAVLGALVLLGVASVLGTLLR